MLILVTGATGKVGRNLIARLLEEKRFSGARIRALCHNRLIDEGERVEVVRGSIAEREVAAAAVADATHIVHLATCKETPDEVMDVTVRGLFWLLEEFRTSESARQFILIGGDAGVGHFHYRHEGPITEKTPHMAYPGCYALSKVLEEVLLEQFGIQYGTNGCCLRAPWIMEKDDFRYSLSFGDDVFGGPDWKAMVPKADAERYAREGTVPVLRDADGKPLKRNFVHVDDLVEAIVLALRSRTARQRLYNICMDEPVNYAAVADYLARTRGLPAKEIRAPYHSNWMDNTRARADLDWRPSYDLEALIESAWTYQRSAEEPRRTWYPG